MDRLHSQERAKHTATADVYTAIVDRTETSVALTRASIASTTPNHLLSAPRDAAKAYLETSGPVVLFPTRRAAEVSKLLEDLGIPYRTAKP